MRTADIGRVLDLIDDERLRREIAPCFLSQPGEGKTTEIERWAKDHGRKVVHIIASQILPSEVSGITMPDRETGSMRVFDHARIGNMEDGDILFFDELLQGQRCVLQACLTLIQERRLMSGKPLPDVIVVAAANPLSSPGQLDRAILDRFMFIEVSSDASDWMEYMRDLGYLPNRNLLRFINESKVNMKGWNYDGAISKRTLTKMFNLMGVARSKGAIGVAKDMLASGDFPTAVVDSIAASFTDMDDGMEKIVESVSEILRSLPDTGRRDEAIAEIEAIGEGTVTDTSALMRVLKSMPEWEDVIKPLLESVKIE